MSSILNDVVGICKCGCGKFILYKEYYSWYGMPKYISGHNTKFGAANPSKREEVRKLISSSKKGKRFSEEHRNKLSLTKLGIKRDDVVKEKIRQSCIKLFSNVKFNRWVQELALSGLKMRPTKPEFKLIGVIKQENFDIEYCGDGKFFIGGFNPDFVNIKQKVVIEVFGDYWHSIESRVEQDKRRMQAYQEAGFKTLVVWEREINTNIQDVIERVKVFLKEGFV